MPKLWTETIDAHRVAVRAATLDATATLVAERGLVAVTMSAIAERTGIGRATLYKYFPDVQAVLDAWHERQIADHLDHLIAIAGRARTPVARLDAVVEAYAMIQHQSREHHGSEMTTVLHGGHRVDEAHRRLHDFLTELLAAAVDAGELRDDVAPDELATYCLHALTAASALSTRPAVHRLVEVTLNGLRQRD